MIEIIRGTRSVCAQRLVELGDAPERANMNRPRSSELVRIARAASDELVVVARAR